jgi:cell division protein FtsZ
MTVLEPGSGGLKFEIQEEIKPRPKIRVIGVGGAGSNAVAHIMSSGLEGVEFCVANTDMQALRASPVPNKLALGVKITGGQGAGSDPEIGRQAALEDTERILELLEGADMVFVAAGLGSGTGTGAAPVVASLAHQLGALTAAIVTKPFSFEGPRRIEQAEQGLAELAQAVDTLVTIPNDRLLALAPRGASLLEAFRMAHEIMRQAVQEIVEIITTPGLINRDFADIRALMRGTGLAVMGTALARGENAAVEAARRAINCPLVEGASIAGARNILVNVTGSSRLGLHELNDACMLIREAAGGEQVQINFGIVLNEAMADAVKLTVIATGFERRAGEQPAASQTAWSAAPPAFQPAPAEELPAAPPQWLTPPEACEAPPAEAAPEEEPADDLEDLDTPPYLKYRGLLQ